MRKMFLVSLSPASGENNHYLLTQEQWDLVHADAAKDASKVVADLLTKGDPVPCFSNVMDLVAHLNRESVQIADELQDVDWEGECEYIAGHPGEKEP